MDGTFSHTMRARLSQVVRPMPWPLLASALCAALATTAVGTTSALDDQDDEHDSLGPPPVYEQLRETNLKPAGRIRDGRLRIDRFEFELTGGELYLLAPTDARATSAVYLGRGLVRCYPPDGVEHQQVRKLLDEDFLEEEFDRFVFWFTDDLGDRLRALADATPGRNTKKAQNLLKDRREELLEQQLENPDSRVLLDLLSPTAPSSAHPQRPYFYAQIDGKDHDWFTIEIEPHDLEEVRVFRFDRWRTLINVWMASHALPDFEAATAEQAFEGFPRDPAVEGKFNLDDDGDDGWDFRDLGLSPRPLRPDREGWFPRVSVPRTDVDIALEGNGDTKASAALLIEPRETLAALRLRISPFLKVTDVRWRTVVSPDVEDVRVVSLLAPEPPSPGAGRAGKKSGWVTGRPDPSKPVALSGEPLHYVQETNNRRMGEDLYESSVTIALPRSVDPGEHFVVEVAYEGKLVRRLRSSQDFLLKDTLSWFPRHPDNRRSRLSLTFRVPERYRTASGGVLADDHVEDKIRIMRWVNQDPVRSMSFHYGRFEVNEVQVEGLPPVTVYANRNHRGFAPGNREKTIADLIGSIRTYSDYFGPYPFDSLLVTETPASGGQAFPGLVLLSFQTFGELHTGEAELFRSHEVAHQWWGAAVDWESYRDQWISEGFAQYAAALHTLIGMGKEQQFADMLDAWRLDVLGEVNIGQAVGLKHYGFTPAVIRKSDGHLSGPVVVGYRLATSDTPMDYRLLVYEKGGFILHMVRMMLTDLKTGNDERFRALMRKFASDHLHEAASTRAFEAAVSRAFDEPMGWFFDQWVYGVDVPTYRPELKVSPLVDAASPFVLHGTIHQEDVPDGFRMPVPIYLRYPNHQPQVHRVWVDAKQVEVEIPLPSEPTDIEFNYQHAVLARVK